MMPRHLLLLTLANRLQVCWLQGALALVGVDGHPAFTPSPGRSARHLRRRFELAGVSEVPSAPQVGEARVSLVGRPHVVRTPPTTTLTAQIDRQR
jgi:hypothetical protein